MRRTLILLLAVVMTFSLFTISPKAEEEIFDGYKLGENDFKFEVAGKEIPELKLVQVQFYDRSGEKPQLQRWNVIKIRDFAQALKDTDGKFSVNYDKDKRTVLLKSGEDYESNGSEMRGIGENPSIEAQNFKFIVNGEEKEIKGVVIDGENYVLTSKLADALGGIRFRSYPGDKHINYVDFDKTDITPFDKEAFEKGVKEHDYTIVYSWGPWCPWSRLSIPHMVKLNEKLKAEGANIQIYGVVNQFQKYSLKDIAPLFEGKEIPWSQVGGSKEAYEYLDAKLGGEKGDIFFFPTMLILDKDGNKVGKTFGQKWDDVEAEYVKSHNIPENVDLTDEQFDEFYPTIYDAFIGQILKSEVKEEKAEEKKEEKAEEKKEEKAEEKKEEKAEEKKEEPEKKVEDKKEEKTEEKNK